MNGDFAYRLKKALQMKHMTQADLVRMTGISKSMISEYVNGKYKPEQNNVYLISAALNVSEVWLMGLSDEMEPAVTKDRNGLDDLYRKITDNDSLRTLMITALNLTQEELEAVLILMQGIIKNKD